MITLSHVFTKIQQPEPKLYLAMTYISTSVCNMVLDRCLLGRQKYETYDIWQHGGVKMRFFTKIQNTFALKTNSIIVWFSCLGLWMIGIKWPFFFLVWQIFRSQTDCKTHDEFLRLLYRRGLRLQGNTLLVSSLFWHKYWSESWPTDTINRGARVGASSVNPWFNHHKSSCWAEYIKKWHRTGPLCNTTNHEVLRTSFAPFR